MDETVIRDAREDDLAAVNDIYNHYVRTSTATFQEAEGSLADRRAWFATHGPDHPVLVADDAGTVVGWASLTPWRPRTAYRHSVEFSVYLRPDAAGRGLGRRLVAALLDRARERGHHVVLGGACAEMTASIRLQEAMGFEKVAHLPEVGRKFGRWLDVVYYAKRLD